MIEPQPLPSASPASGSPDASADPVQSGSSAPADPVTVAPAPPASPQPTGLPSTTAAHSAVAASNHHHVGDPATGKKLALLTLTALGVVYGDIGTSPLYALKECFNSAHGVEPTAENVIGVLSMIVWSLICVVSVKYIGFILRADNRGEGGILALLALLLQKTGGEIGRAHV